MMLAQVCAISQEEHPPNIKNLTKRFLISKTSSGVVTQIRLNVTLAGGMKQYQNARKTTKLDNTLRQTALQTANVQHMPNVTTQPTNALHVREEKKIASKHRQSVRPLKRKVLAKMPLWQEYIEVLFSGLRLRKVTHLVSTICSLMPLHS